MISQLREYIHHWYWTLFFKLFPEWTENWAAWPHCCGQAGCWMHYQTNFWCACRCRWCWVARNLDKHRKHRVSWAKREEEE